MGIFSLFSKSKAKNKETYKELFTKDLLAHMLDNSRVMMLAYSIKHGWIGGNKQFYKVLGYKNIEDFKRQHKSVQDMFLSQEEEIFTDNDRSWLQYLKKHKKHGHYVRMYNANKEILEINLRCFSSEGSHGIYILEFEDVSKLHVAHNQVKEIDRLKSEFLAMIGHEFRTPMNSILGFIELLEQTPLSKSQKEYLELIGNSSKNLMSNIETLLDLSQMQDGQLQINNSTFEIVPNMEDLIHNCMIVAREKGVKIFNFIDPRLPKEMVSDIKKITQIMNALINDAIKHTNRGGRILIEIKLLSKQLNGDCSVGFSVKDNGKTMSKSEIERISKLFHSGNKTEERLGVYLNLASGLVKLFGSELNIKSEPNGENHFNFYLNFKGTQGQAYKMMPKQVARVVLLDKSRIEEAKVLSSYLRSFAIDVVKSHTLDERVYDGVDSVYIIADQKDSSWIFKLGTYTKKTSIAILLDEGERLQTKLTSIVDEVIYSPLFISNVHEHLAKMNHMVIDDNLFVQENRADEKLRVLTVEDNMINQKLIKTMLQNYDVDLWLAENGNEAIDMCLNRKFDLIFMDIEMPEKNGIEATQEIKQMTNLNMDTPIIALTAMAMQGDREMLLDAGLDDYISKPINKEKLHRVITQYIM